MLQQQLIQQDKQWRKQDNMEKTRHLDEMHHKNRHFFFPAVWEHESA